MNAQRRTAFVSVNITPEARDALRQATLDLTTPVGQRLAMSDVLLKAIQVAMTHKAELVESFTEQPNP